MGYKINPFTGKLDEVGPVLTGTGTVSAAADGTAADPGIAFTSDLNTGIYRPGADQLAISTNGVGRLFVDASGNVGIGTATPAGRLHVTGGDSIFGAGNLTRILNANQIIDFTNAAQNTYVAGRINGLNLKFYTNTGTGIDIDSNGRVGIGTTSPSYRLSVVGDAGTNIVSTITSQVSSGAYIGYFDTTTTDRPLVGAVGNDFVFRTGSTERVRIASDGKVGIGTSNPAVALQIGTTGSGGFAFDSSTQIIYPTFGSTGNLTLRAQTTATTGGGEIYLGGGTRGDDRVNAIVFSTANVDRGRIDSSGRLLVGLASANTSGAKLQTVDGITFPATQVASSDPNTLDDYEEGTWTPAITFATPGDLSVTYSTQSGTYEKIGRLVVVRFVITTSAFTHTTAANGFQITGLPFARQNLNPNFDGTALCSFRGITSATFTQFGIASAGAGTTNLGVVKSGSGVTTTSVVVADVPSGGTVSLVGQYSYVA